MKILELEKELNTLKNENKVPEDFANYYEMRKDMGVKKTKKGKLLSFFVNDIENAMKNK